jgi:hypothetical protein
VGALSDRELLVHVQRASANERRASVELVALLAELDARRLYLPEGYSSLFTYCTQALHLSEHAAYNRIEAARAARRFPVVLDRLAEGSLHLTAIRLVAPHLTPTNHIEVLDAARHKSKREVEQLVAQLHARPDAPAVVRRLPERPATAPSKSAPKHEPCGLAAAPTRPSAPPVSQRHTDPEPLGPERYKIQFTVGRETYEQLRRVQDLLRHVIPSGDLGAIFQRALALLLADLSKKKIAAAERPRVARAPRHRSRHIPAAVKREVWRRDGGRCAFSGTQGRCTETGFIEFHHVVPFAAGGNTTSDNVELRCRAHNSYEAEQWFDPGEPPLLREPREPYSA